MSILAENEHLCEGGEKHTARHLWGDDYLAINMNIVRMVGINGAILLQYFARWSESSRRPDRAVWRTRVEIEKDTTIKPDAQETAIKRLQGAGLVDVTREGQDRRNYYRVNFDAAFAIVFGGGEIPSPPRLRNTPQGLSEVPPPNLGDGISPSPVTVDYRDRLRSNPVTIRRLREEEKEEDSVDTADADASEVNPFPSGDSPLDEFVHGDPRETGGPGNSPARATRQSPTQNFGETHYSEPADRLAPQRAALTDAVLRKRAFERFGVFDPDELSVSNRKRLYEDDEEFEPDMDDEFEPNTDLVAVSMRGGDQDDDDIPY